MTRSRTCPFRWHRPKISGRGSLTSCSCRITCTCCGICRATLAHIHAILPLGGLLISKTPMLGQAPFYIRWLVPMLQAVGKAPYLTMLTAADLELALTQAGFACDPTRMARQPRPRPARLHRGVQDVIGRDAMPMPWTYRHASREWRAFLEDVEGWDEPDFGQHGLYGGGWGVPMLPKTGHSSRRLGFCQRFCLLCRRAIFVAGWQPMDPPLPFGPRADLVAEVKALRAASQPYAG